MSNVGQFVLFNNAVYEITDSSPEEMGGNLLTLQRTDGQGRIWISESALWEERLPMASAAWVLESEVKHPEPVAERAVEVAVMDEDGTQVATGVYTAPLSTGWFGPATRPQHHKPRKITPAMIIEIEDSRAGGTSIRQLALDFGVSHRTIRRYI